MSGGPPGSPEAESPGRTAATRGPPRRRRPSSLTATHKGAAWRAGRRRLGGRAGTSGRLTASPPLSAAPRAPAEEPVARCVRAQLVTRVRSGLICSPAPSASIVGPPARRSRSAVPRTIRSLPPPRARRARGNERASVRRARAWGEPCAREGRVRGGPDSASCGARGRGVERGASTERAGGRGGEEGAAKAGGGAEP